MLTAENGATMETDLEQTPRRPLRRPPLSTSVSFVFAWFCARQAPKLVSFDAGLLRSWTDLVHSPPFCFCRLPVARAMSRLCR